MAKLILDAKEVRKALLDYVITNYRDSLGLNYTEATSSNAHDLIEWTDYRLQVTEELVFSRKEVESE
ncbi:hypothetical protein [Arthrobacter sp. NicSoilC5]|uniref:hypothetical protein n=1 Tax=Arthrobacter sp. NicSoilC5 TaxID=2831000 RepID=UPI001CC77CC5|nr:hypothetical protein [Arthrobacter sp. NicSoilC5]BCW78304.1 hypothetical protein NicSoilC5_03230 [Arthrobacter sp. NicSoilC5]